MLKKFTETLYFLQNAAVPLKTVKTDKNLIYNFHDQRIDKDDGGNGHQAQQEQEGVPVQLKICGFWVQDRADELPFSSAET